MPLGSSSATPVIKPGPTRASGCSLMRLHMLPSGTDGGLASVMFDSVICAAHLGSRATRMVALRSSCIDATQRPVAPAPHFALPLAAFACRAGAWVELQVLRLIDRS